MADYSRELPFSLEAEQSVLGAILINPDCMDALSGDLRPEDFMRPEHQAIYRTMKDMYSKSRSIDPVTLIEELVKQGVNDEAGGQEYLKIVMDATPTSRNVADYAAIVRDKALLRSLVQAGEKISEEALREQDEASAVLENAEAAIYQISQKRDNKDFTPINEALLSTYNHLQEIMEHPENSKGISTGFSGIDQKIVGLGKNDLVYLGGRPGMGKTSLAINIAVNVAKAYRDKTVCIFSLEMSVDQVVQRILASESLVEVQKMRSGELDETDFEKLAYSIEALGGTKIMIDDSAQLTVANIRSKLRRVKNLGLVVIDYLQLMASDAKSENRVVEVGAISRGLKLIAKEMSVPVICCAQLNRDSAKGGESKTREPELSDLRESGSLEQDADMVFLLYRKDYFDKSATDPAIVKVAKNRHGPTGNVEMAWLEKYTKFTTLESHHDEPEPW